MPDKRIYSRREMLKLAGATAATTLVGCGIDGSSAGDGSGTAESSAPRSAAERTATPAEGTTAQTAVPSCVVRPEQTEGPYFVDEVLRRSDIRTEPSDGTVKEGAPLRLAFEVSRMNGDACRPIPGAIVDVWQCDALGVYSDFRDMSGDFDTRGQRFLRGYQETNADGRAEFTTIYPGWYPGRAVHIHFKIRTDPEADRGGREFTSQVYFDDAVTAQVHERNPYALHGPPPEKNDDDGIFRRGGDQLMLDLVSDGEGYAGTFAIGLEV